MTKQTTDWTLETIRAQFRNTRIYDESAVWGSNNIHLDNEPESKWGDAKQAYFVRSIKLGIPLPPLVFSGEPGKLKIIDGHERIRAILNFYEENNAEFENLTMRCVIFDKPNDEFLFHLVGLLNLHRPMRF